jgi:hypothetical protein
MLYTVNMVESSIRHNEETKKYPKAYITSMLPTFSQDMMLTNKEGDEIWVVTKLAESLKDYMLCHWSAWPK